MWFCYSLLIKRKYCGFNPFHATGFFFYASEKYDKMSGCLLFSRDKGKQNWYQKGKGVFACTEVLNVKTYIMHHMHDFFCLCG